MVAGVNGVGKTTTIGKLGKILKKNNKKVVLGAADTFRAAAVEQLSVWAKKIDAHIASKIKIMNNHPYFLKNRKSRSLRTSSATSSKNDSGLAI